MSKCRKSLCTEKNELSLGPFILSCMQLAIRVQLGEIVRETRRVAKLQQVACNFVHSFSLHFPRYFERVASCMQLQLSMNGPLESRNHSLILESSRDLFSFSDKE